MPVLFFTLGVLPQNGQPNVVISRSTNYTSLEGAIQSITNALISPPLAAHLPPPPPDEE